MSEHVEVVGAGILDVALLDFGIAEVSALLAKESRQLTLILVVILTKVKLLILLLFLTSSLGKLALLLLLVCDGTRSAGIRCGQIEQRTGQRSW